MVQQASHSSSVFFLLHIVERTCALPLECRLEDGGSIYVLAPQPNSVMAENYVACQRKLYGSLYTDEGSAYWLIQSNVVNGGPEWLHM